MDRAQHIVKNTTNLVWESAQGGVPAKTVARRVVLSIVERLEKVRRL